MRLYFLGAKRAPGYDAYDSLVIVAGSVAAARRLILTAEPHGPGTRYQPLNEKGNVEVTYIGRAALTLQEGEVIISSFNAG